MSRSSLGVTLLGSTGSIGKSTLDVLALHPERFHLVALTAYSQLDLLFEQCCRFKPLFAVVANEAAARELRPRLSVAGIRTEVLQGEGALETVASLPQTDAVMAAIVGAAGLRPAMAAARAGKRVMLANKESLVVAGALFMQAVRASGATLLPVDSEHNAIFQSLPSGFNGDMAASGVEKLVLTASGGPFRRMAAADLEHVTVEQACAHPNWSMGRKISVDSATLMNKGLELIEAHWLFNMPAADIEVVVHPQSVIHSMVRYRDGSVIAQLGAPDMRTPIAYALSWPERIEAGVERLDFLKLGSLTFEAPDMARFPCLALAYQALSAGGDACCVLNAANEVAVAAFLAGKIGFADIARQVEAALAALDLSASTSIDGLMARDAEARRFVATRIG
ncbi:1-deoxy-D-xylulose-5-phosphate reductoisomerase [Craterilacuibacter sinensis]|uniref:1-deoxy-D-xylulose 5-phosphate reductoisomerase n=1 Tax=Craterilacuibacter sinensis TaxID=2686017 RepID=A0A845BKS0_9NEIS|nr:1-deoxy-D-xylulose-5-phosphate reductoisomerase [Craterilacuibacter sinensis]MXR36935.1 1-deoxy-D-xylulose-5-phosphate reductoisomerase [Craterilacuibacter sinensis]